MPIINSQVKPFKANAYHNGDFITVTKADDTDWQSLKPQVLGAIMEHFVAGRPVIEGEDAAAHEDVLPEDAEIVTQIKDLLDTRVRPAVAGDGGDIVFRGYRDGVVKLHMQGACSGCPSSSATLTRPSQSVSARRRRAWSLGDSRRGRWLHLSTARTRSFPRPPCRARAHWPSPRPRGLSRARSLTPLGFAPRPLDGGRSARRLPRTLQPLVGTPPLMPRAEPYTGDSAGRSS